MTLTHARQQQLQQYSLCNLNITTAGRPLKPHPAIRAWLRMVTQRCHNINKSRLVQEHCGQKGDSLTDLRHQFQHQVVKKKSPACPRQPLWEQQRGGSHTWREGISWGQTSEGPKLFAEAEPEPAAQPKRLHTQQKEAK